LGISTQWIALVRRLTGIRPQYIVLGGPKSPLMAPVLRRSHQGRNFQGAAAYSERATYCRLYCRRTSPPDLLRKRLKGSPRRATLSGRAALAAYPYQCESAGCCAGEEVAQPYCATLRNDAAVCGRLSPRLARRRCDHDQCREDRPAASGRSALAKHKAQSNDL
jgi:hypothetical protein